MFSMLLGFVSPFLKKVLPYGIAIVVTAGALAYTYHLGYSNATNLCKERQNQAQVQADSQQLKNLQSQIVQMQQIIQQTTTEKEQQQIQINHYKQAIDNEVHTNPSCNIGSNVIQLLNRARSAGNQSNNSMQSTSNSNGS